MATILVSGLINIETTLQVERFPVEYTAVRYPFFGVNSTVSGVGYNVAKALTTLSDTVLFASLIGKDIAGEQVKTALASDGIPGDYVINALDETPQSVILYDKQGQRVINVDLKDIQENVYPEALTNELIAACDVAVLCNINFSRALLARAKQAGKLIATDVHSVSDVDEYNLDFMKYADILFMSHEHLPCSPEEWARLVRDRFDTEIIVIGLGSDGAMLSVRSRNFMERYPAVTVRPVVNTIGAGDALFSAFLHFYVKGEVPHTALRKAIVFAGHKVGEKGAASGFLEEAKLSTLFDSFR